MESKAELGSFVQRGPRVCGEVGSPGPCPFETTHGPVYRRFAFVITPARYAGERSSLTYQVASVWLTTPDLRRAVKVQDGVKDTK